jgi:hypothetical protein
MADSGTENRKYYVYGLVDPRTGAVFYVGKGSGRRMYQHEVDAKAGRISNGAKHARIIGILQSGERIQYHTFRANTTEDDALRLERQLITTLGGLTNECSGQVTADERVMSWLSRVRPFCLWRRLRAWTPGDMRMYWEVVAGLQKELSPDAKYGA